MPVVLNAKGSTGQGLIPKAYRASVFEYASATYAVVTKYQADQASGGFVVVNLSDPAVPSIVFEQTDVKTGDNDNPSSNWELLNGSFAVSYTHLTLPTTPYV